MSHDMKITMLGLSTVGKTCYMLAMYNKMSEGVNGFTLIEKDLDKDLKLSNEWDKLVYNSKWPDATTNEVLTYNFDFNYALTTKIMGFEWIDYRGGALTDSYTEKDVEMINQHLCESSCVFLCVSGELLCEPVDNSVIAKSGSRRMMALLTKIGKKIPLVIVITKYDLCKKLRGKSAIIEDIKKIFSVLFERGTEWPVLICPVTLGIDISNSDDSLIAPIGVHLPLIFAIYSEVMKDAYEAESLVKQSKIRLEQLQDRNWFPKLIDKFQGIDRVGSATSDLRKNEQKMKEIQQKMILLTRELNNSEVDLFYDGKKGGVYV